jgi:hypothetical protein
LEVLSVAALEKFAFAAALVAAVLIGTCVWTGLAARHEINKIRNRLASLPGVQILEFFNFQEEDFGGPEIYVELQIDGTTIVLDELTPESLRCEDGIWLRRFAGSSPLCLQENGPGVVLRDAINLCRTSPVWNQALQSIDELPGAFAGIRAEISRWPSSPDGTLGYEAGGQWRCFLAPPGWRAPKPTGFIVGS